MRLSWSCVQKAVAEAQSAASEAAFSLLRTDGFGTVALAQTPASLCIWAVLAGHETLCYCREKAFPNQFLVAVDLHTGLSFTYECFESIYDITVKDIRILDILERFIFYS